MRYLLNPNVSIIRNLKSKLIICHQSKNYDFSNPLIRHLISFLDEARDWNYIRSSLENHESHKIRACLLSLLKRQIIMKVDDDVNESNLLSLVDIGLNCHEAHHLLQKITVGVYAFEGNNPSPLLEQLTNIGISSTTNISQDVNFCLAICSNYLEPKIQEVSYLLSNRSIPWMLIGQDERNILIGPIFDRESEGCYVCLSDILSYNTNKYQKSFLVSRSSLHTSNIAHTIAINETVKYLANLKPDSKEFLLSIDPYNYSLKKHYFHRNPICSSCGTSFNNDDFRPLKIEAELSTYKSDAGLRKVSAKETFEKYKVFISPYTGIVGEIKKLECELTSVHVYTSSYNSVVRNESVRQKKDHIRSICAGKGSSDMQARVSALCEAIERFSSQRHGTESSENLSLLQARELYGNKALHPNDVMLFSESQYNHRDIVNQDANYFNYVPNRLPEQHPICWSKLWSLTSNQKFYLPTQLLFNGTNSESIDRFAIGCSNGCAAGNTIEDATLQGLLEVIERDCIAIWWYNMINRESIDLNSISDKWINLLLEEMSNINRHVWVLNITSDLEIPCFAAFSRETIGESEKILFGFGCHIEPMIALKRALAEMVQNLVPVLKALDKSTFNNYDNIAFDWVSNASISKYPYLGASNDVPPISISSFSHQSSGKIVSDLNFLINKFKNIGLEVLVIDQTRKFVNMPVVKVVVPGLRHFWSRFAPGRLYDVPTKCRWLKHSLAEDKLNSIPIFF